MDGAGRRKLMKILLAAFYTPGIRAIEWLIQSGFEPEQIRLLTHTLDRNRCLVDFASTHRIETCVFAVKSDDARHWVEAFGPDVLFSLYFRDIIPQAILARLPLGGVNLHPSLLPRARGAFSVPWTIINGDRVTGITYHHMTAAVDAGNILLQKEVPVRPDDTAYSLYHRLIAVGMDAFPEALELAKTAARGSPQVGNPTYYPRKVPFDGYIEPSWDRTRVDRLIRALRFPPFKGAVVRLRNGEEREVRSLDEYDMLLRAGLVRGNGAAEPSGQNP
jgi:UDP-4-amino-4-deoxy-L-arabinose formyltransferase/UDP-glucuronic acid dehydrogenase (UDP-4-keto-hexauronic acid decarboxylating)